MDSDALIILLIVLMMLSGLAVLLMAMHGRRRLRELQHQERIAMINRGLVPPPERDPGRFERGMGAPAPQLGRAERIRSAGVVLIGFGLGLAVLLAFAAGSPSTGVGIGGAFAMLGAALVLNGVLSSRPDPYFPAEPPPAPRLDQLEPPSKLG